MQHERGGNEFPGPIAVRDFLYLEYKRLTFNSWWNKEGCELLQKCKGKNMNS